MIVTPVFSFYLQAAGPLVVEGGIRPEDIEQVEFRHSSSGTRPLRGPIILGVPGESEDPGGPEEIERIQYTYRCFCQEVIESTYTSQYVAGIAFIVTAFVKRSEVTLYHLRVIYSIVSMHSVLGLISNYHRQSLLSFWASFIGFSRKKDEGRNKKQPFKMLDFALLFNLALFVSFSIFVPLQHDNCFRVCYSESIGTFLGSLGGFLALLCISLYGNGVHGPSAWTIFTILMACYVGFQNWVFYRLTHTFRPTTLDPGVSSELTFSFGQILVLFMIVPLVVEYLAAMLGEDSYYPSTSVKYH